jgi:uncharacterized protein (DUF1778 family)
MISAGVAMARTALLIRCSAREAGRIREDAAAERRSVSAYVLTIVVRSLEVEEALSVRLRNGLSSWNRNLSQTRVRRTEPRTAILVRCSIDEAARIRAAAARREVTISGFVLHSLRRAWNVRDAGPSIPLPKLR